MGWTNEKGRDYTMYEHIKKTRVEKDIEVVIDNKLISDHLTEKVNKANCIVGLIRQTFMHLECYL